MRRAALFLLGLTACGDAAGPLAMGGTTGDIATSSGSTAGSTRLPASSSGRPEVSGSSASDDSGSTTGGASSSDGAAETGTGSSTSAEPPPSVVVQLVGNSYTAGGVGPMLTALAAQAGLVIEARVIAPLPVSPAANGRGPKRPDRTSPRSAPSPRGTLRADP